MKGLEALAHDGHLTEDELGEHAEQLHQDLALLRHRQTHGFDAGVASAIWCEACNSEIPEARRRALPGVNLCVDCAREAERQERGFR